MSNVTVSSRTPDGVPNQCPICKNTIQLEPSVPFGDAPCPNCGSLLWFIATNASIRFFARDESSAAKERATSIAAEILGIDEKELLASPHSWNELGADSLDTVELVMELEQEYG